MSSEPVENWMIVTQASPAQSFIINLTNVESITTTASMPSQINFSSGKSIICQEYASSMSSLLKPMTVPNSNAASKFGLFSQPNKRKIAKDDEYQDEYNNANTNCFSIFSKIGCNIS
jgi:hypothetical protein